MPMPYDDKPHPPTFGQVSSNSDVAFWKYGSKKADFWPIFDSNPYNPEIKNFFEQVRLAMVPRNSQLILFETSIQH